MDVQHLAEPSVAETLPEAYRRVLDRVADLETAGHRREADLVRCDAIAAYSRRWDERAVARLDRLAARADRVLAGREQPRRPGRSSMASLQHWVGRVPTRLRLATVVAGSKPSPRPEAMTPEHPSA